VNPEHLEVVTCRENVLRGNGHAAVNARKTHCNRGHELTGSNLLIDVGTRKRRCRECRNRDRRVQAARRRQAAAR
jgi:hypothetical protein